PARVRLAASDPHVPRQRRRKSDLAPARGRGRQLRCRLLPRRGRALERRRARDATRVRVPPRRYAVPRPARGGRAPRRRRGRHALARPRPARTRPRPRFRRVGVVTSGRRAVGRIMNSSHLLATVNLVLGGLVFLLGFVILRENPRQRLSRVVSLMLFFGGFGAVLAALSLLVPGKADTAGLQSNVAYVWELFFPTAFLLASIFPEERSFARP